MQTNTKKISRMHKIKLWWIDGMWLYEKGFR